jgi:SAM-dependent methyltransferase
MKAAPNAEAVAFFAEPDRYFAKDYFIDVRCGLVRALAGPVAGKRILDLGCGDGRVSLQFCGEASHVTLVDLSRAMLARARRRIPVATRTKVDIVCADVEHFSDPTPFDVVLCMGVLAHVASVPRMLSVTAKALAPGGAAIFQFTDAGVALGRLALRAEQARSRRMSGKEHWLRPLSLASVSSDAARAGLRLDAMKRHGVTVPGMGRLPNAALGRWDRFVLSTPVLARFGSDVVAKFVR